MSKYFLSGRDKWGLGGLLAKKRVRAYLMVLEGTGTVTGRFVQISTRGENEARKSKGAAIINCTMDGRRREAARNEAGQAARESRGRAVESEAKREAGPQRGQHLSFTSSASRES